MSNKKSGFVQVKGAREHNLQNVSLDIPRDQLVVFTGISGSGKSSLAFGTLYAEAQRRYLESVSPYARRLFHQMPVPEVEEITGLPPAVALQQQRGTPTTRSSVGSVTTLSNSLRMLYSRAGDYPRGQALLYAESFSANTPEGACPICHGLGRMYDATEKSMVPDPSLTIRERAVAAWPPAWHGQNLRDILVSLGYDVDTPWRDLPKKARDWILFTDDQPTAPVYAGYTPAETRAALRRKEEPSYQGTFTGARRYVLQTFANTESALMKRRVVRYLVSRQCPSCHGKRLRAEALKVKFDGLDITELSRLPLKALAEMLRPRQARSSKDADAPEKALVKERIAADLVERLSVLLDLGLGYLTLERSTPTLSPGELQRLRLATQVRSSLFGVVYVMDEPSAGLHPADTEALLRALAELRSAGNSLFIVEHAVDVIRRADWIVDVGPEAGAGGGRILYSGPPSGLKQVASSKTAQYLFEAAKPPQNTPRRPRGWIRLAGVTHNNLHDLSAAFPLGVITAVTGVSGSGKSSLVSRALIDLARRNLGQEESAGPEELSLEEATQEEAKGRIVEGLKGIRRLITVDQKPIGRTPRSNVATYTGLFDHVRKLFASTKQAKARRYDAGRFSFNVVKGRCPKCEGEGQVMVELLFLPSVYAPCPQCHGRRYNDKTLEVKYRDHDIAQVLDMSVERAWDFFQEEASLLPGLRVLREVGLGYLKLGQSATELSGGEAQRIKLATELQRAGRGDSLYILDEPTTGLHPFDVDKLILQVAQLADAGNTVVIVEHNMRVIAACDWVIDIGPGAGDEGGKIVIEDTPTKVARSGVGRTSAYLARFMGL